MKWRMEIGDKNSNNKISVPVSYEQVLNSTGYKGNFLSGMPLMHSGGYLHGYVSERLPEI